LPVEASSLLEILLIADLLFLEVVLLDVIHFGPAIMRKYYTGSISV
jgi:hypothetical protein